MPNIATKAVTPAGSHSPSPRAADRRAAAGVGGTALPSICTECEGSGIVRGFRTHSCDNCHGSGDMPPVCDYCEGFTDSEGYCASCDELSLAPVGRIAPGRVLA